MNRMTLIVGIGFNSLYAFSVYNNGKWPSYNGADAVLLCPHVSVGIVEIRSIPPSGSSTGPGVALIEVHCLVCCRCCLQGS